MGAHELDLGGDTFAFFTRNPRGGASRAADPEDAAKLMRLLTEHSFGPLVAHAPYTLNACSTNERVAAFAREAMTGDLLKMQLLPGQFYNFHPGSHLGQGPEKAIPQIAAVVNEALAAVPEGRTTVLLETMAGKGSEVGRTFEELRMIMDRIDRPERIGVTLDTCHVWDAGYDIAGNLDGVLKEFDEVIGLEHLKAIHLNDSKNLNSREDYFFSVKGVNASGFPLGKRTSPGFMLNKGSMVSIRHAPSLRQPVIDVKNDLIMRKILVINTKLNCYELKESYLLTSPSFAASLVAGNTRNGLDVWTNQEGFSLKDSGYGPKAGDVQSDDEDSRKK